MGNPHPTYSPDFAPLDFYLFCSLQNNLNGKQFDSTDEVKNYIRTFFEEKGRSFYKGIQKLVKPWERVIENDGEYIID